MARIITYVPRTLFFLAGVAIAALTFPRRERAGTDRDHSGVDRSGMDRSGMDRSGMDPATTEELKRSLANLETRLQTREAADAARFSQVETRLEEHAAKPADLPSTTQIVSAMEQLLSRTMASLDERLTTQAHSIEVLKTTVTQTDSLLERVLESLDSLQSFTDSADFAEDPLLSRPAV